MSLSLAAACKRGRHGSRCCPAGPEHGMLVEKNDFASGTTSWSTRLVHGGLRYLEYFEFNLVRESPREREVLLRNAPHLAADSDDDSDLPQSAPAATGNSGGHDAVRHPQLRQVFAQPPDALEGEDAAALSGCGSRQLERSGPVLRRSGRTCRAAVFEKCCWMPSQAGADVLNYTTVIFGLQREGASPQPD
jgi:hypothetical protein